MSDASLLRNKRLVIGTILVLVASFAAYAYRKVYRIHGFIVALAPIDGNQAVVCMRANAEWGKPPRAWIGLLDAPTGQWVWSNELRDLPAGGDDALIVDDGQAFVRTETATIAYETNQGRHLWTTPLKQKFADTGVPFVALPKHIVQGGERTKDKQPIFVLDRETGKLEETHDIHSIDVFRPRIQADRIVLEGVLDTEVSPLLEPAKRGKLPVTAGCIENDQYVTLDVLSPLEYELATYSLIDGARKPLVHRLRFFGPKPIAPIACAKYKDQHVFLFSTDTKLAGRLGILFVSPDENAADRFMWLGFDPIAAATPDNLAFSGDLPRFVPFLAPAPKDPKASLVIADLDQLKVTRGPDFETALVTTIFRSGTDFYVQAPDAAGKPLLARFDGAKGELAAAIDVTDMVRTRPARIKGGKLWLNDDAWLPKPPFVVVDAQTLAGSLPDSLPRARAAWLPPRP